MAVEDKIEEKVPLEIGGDKGKEPEPKVEVVEQTDEQKAAAQDAVKTGKPQETPWYIKRIGELNAKFRDAERANAQMANELSLATQALEQINAKGKQPESKQEGLTKEEIDRRIDLAAQGKAAQQKFADDCNTILADGNTKFADFGTKITGLAPVVGDKGLPVSVIEAAMETGKAAEVIYALASDLDETTRIMGLSPTKQAVAIARLADRLEKPKEISKVPPPPKPIAGAIVSDKDPDKMSAEEWFAWRNSTIEKRRREGEFVQ